MKVLVVFVLLFGVALSRPARSFSNSDSDSSEEVTFKASADSDESTEAADEDNEEEEEEEEEEEDDSSNSSESGESTTDSPATPTPIMVTEEPFGETTIEPIMPTIITDPDQGRGDSLGGYPSDYKSIVYAEDKSYNKIPSPYKSYEYVEEGKKSAYDMTHGNEVEKSMMVYKALQVHSDYLEEDTSTPEVDSQSLDNSVGAPEELNPRQASLPAEEEEEEATANSDSTNSDSGSSSTPEEEEDSASASQDDEDDESQSNEESEQSDESDESDSDEQGAGPDTSTDEPVVITAK
ncbi:uncharacterized protein ACB057_000829 [Neosynchiropus ocellatus]